MLRESALLVVGLTVGAIAIDARSSAQSRRSWQRLHPQVAQAPLSGSLPSLLKARLVASRALVVSPRDGQLLADGAYVEALLAHDYGLPSVRTAEEGLARASAGGVWPRPSTGVVLGAKALLALGRGDQALGLELGRGAAAASENARPDNAQREDDDVRPLLALGRAQLEAGDLRAASSVFEAAVVRAPRAAAPLVGWAEAQLGAGSRAGVSDALAEAIRREPDHTRALLLEAEVRALGATPPPTAAQQAAAETRLRSACARDGESSPVLEASCTLLSAVTARLRGDRAAAMVGARSVLGPDTRAAGRDLALATLLLTQLGEVDVADEALARLQRRRGRALSADHPLLAWAQVTLASARSEPPPRALPPFPQHPETRLSAAREALAEGGREGLAAALEQMGASEAIASDPDLRSLSRLLSSDPVAEVPGEGLDVDPVLAFVEGLRAQWAGDLPASTRWLGRALNRHADACRAAGHHLPALALLGVTPGTELEPLRSVNARCSELAWTEPDPEPTPLEVASPVTTAP